MRRTPLFAALAIVTACATDVPTTAPLHRVVAAPASVVTTTFIGTGFAFPARINDHDVVTGYFRAGITDHAFRWTASGGIQDLHGSAPWLISRGEDISNAGHVVGHAYESNGSTWPYAWIWTPAEPSLRRLSTSFSSALGVNDDGMAVGYVVAADNNTRFATAWPAAGGEIRNSVPFTVALDVNDAGQVLVQVGFGFAIWNPVADPTGVAMKTVKVADFPGSGWLHFSALQIDEAGRVTGLGNRSAFLQGAFLWTPGTGAGTVQHLPSSGRSGAAYAINAANQVAGFVTNPSNGQTLPAYWPSAGAEAVLLPDPIGNMLGRATSINANGKIVGWSANSGGRGILWDLNGTAVNIPPTANAGPDQTLECVLAMANATLDGRGSSDPDGEIVDYSWRWLALNLVVATGPTPTLSLGQGVHEFALTVKDDDGASAEDRVRVEVRDSHAPEITLTQHATELWPPDRRMVKVASGIKASDACAGGATVTVSVTSNQEIGDDYQILGTPDGLEVLVRATRDARDADGRTYTVTVTANDGTHQATRVASILVPRAPR